MNNTNEDIIILQDSPESESRKKKNIKIGFLDRINTWFLESQKMKLTDKVTFYRLLATMVNAGITVMTGVKILHTQEKNAQVRLIEEKLMTSLQSGNTLSVSLADHPKSFGPAEIAIAESGEKTGKLNDALIQLAEQIEKLSSIGKKLKGAMMYPAVILIVMVLVVVVIMIKVVPQLVSLFGDFDSLPKATQILIRISDFFVNFWWSLALIPILGPMLIRFWTRTSWGKYQFDMVKLHIPVFGSLMKKVILSKFSRLLANLLGNGVAILEAVRIISDAVGNEVYRQRLLLLRDDIKRGIKIGDSLEDDKLFPDMVVQMIKIGEETAKLDTIIVKIADFYDEEVDTTINSMNKIIEPIIIVTMAWVIGLIAVAVITPIFSLSETVTQ